MQNQITVLFHMHHYNLIWRIHSIALIPVQKSVSWTFTDQAIFLGDSFLSINFRKSV